MSELAHVFPDTNIFLHFKALDGLDWCRLCGTKKVILQIAQAFLAELNKAKDTGGSSVVRKRAKSIQRRLKAIHAGEDAKLPAGVSVQFSAKSPNISGFPGLNPNVADDALLAAVLVFKEEAPGTKVFVATDDDGFGLQIKCGSHGIQVVEPPEEWRLEPEPDEKELELRHLRKEVDTLRNARPKLSVHFAEGVDQLRFSTEKIDVVSRVNAFMKKLRIEHRELRVPDEPKGLFAAISMQNIALTPEAVAAYNHKLPTFFAESEETARRILEAKSRTFFFALSTGNSGSAPANDLTVSLHFPDGFTLREKEEWDDFLRNLPEPPEKPTTPFERMRSLQAMTSPARAFHFGATRSNAPQPSLSVRKTNSYDVRFAHPKLKHGQQAELGDFALTFDERPFSFEVEYEAVADNVPEVLRGKLQFVMLSEMMS